MAFFLFRFLLVPFDSLGSLFLSFLNNTFHTIVPRSNYLHNQFLIYRKVNLFNQVVGVIPSNLLSFESFEEEERNK